MAKCYSADAIRFRQALLELSAALDALVAHGDDPASECVKLDDGACPLHFELVDAAHERAKALLAEKWDAPALRRAR